MYTLILLAPGSFLILAMMGIVRLFGRRNGSPFAGRPWSRWFNKCIA
jgi:hypothetical protein